MKTHTRHHKSHRTSAKVSFKESLLVVLVAVLAGVAIYTSADSNTAFGLLNQPVYADFVPSQITFRTTALTSEPFLELQLVDRNKPTTQVAANIFDATNPPPVTDLTALNTRIGGEVMVYWTLPSGATAVNVYRTDVTIGEKETRIADGVVATEYQDTTVSNGDIYRYRVVSIVVDGDNTFESKSNAPTVDVAPSDTVPPQAPTDVRVIEVESEAGKSLQIAWTNPIETDVATIQVYRSTHFGTRGDKIATVQAADSSEYEDTTAPKNTTLYYTVVAVDQAGNASSDDFQMPLPGNTSPFTPIGVAP